MGKRVKRLEGNAQCSAGMCRAGELLVALQPCGSILQDGLEEGTVKLRGFESFAQAGEDKLPSSPRNVSCPHPRQEQRSG